MSRRYADPIAVTTIRTADGEYPEGFRWRGGHYRVRTVLARWIEAEPWWRSQGFGSVPAQDSRDGSGGSGGGRGRSVGRPPDRLVWRVEAEPRRGAPKDGSPRSGVFELCAVGQAVPASPSPRMEQAVAWGGAPRSVVAAALADEDGQQWYLVRALD